MATQAAATREQGNFKHWHLERDIDGIAWLYIDRDGEKVNSLSSEVLGELGEIIDLFEQDAPTGLVLMSGKPATSDDQAGWPPLMQGRLATSDAG